MIETFVSASLSMAAIGISLGCVLGLARRRWATPDATKLVDTIDACLPQIQCAQCGYPGCRPYAQAIAAGAPLDLCPPGGPETVRRLGDLLASSASAHAPDAHAVDAMPEPQNAVASIDETRCIGCALCLQACPVDAILGAANFMHTVASERCTGCELCVAPCPVDCIELVPREPDDTWSWPCPSNP